MGRDIEDHTRGEGFTVRVSELLGGGFWVKCVSTWAEEFSRTLSFTENKETSHSELSPRTIPAEGSSNLRGEVSVPSPSRIEAMGESCVARKPGEASSSPGCCTWPASLADYAGSRPAFRNPGAISFLLVEPVLVTFPVKMFTVIL